jgi:hypothetical protein
LIDSIYGAYQSPKYQKLNHQLYAILKKRSEIFFTTFRLMIVRNETALALFENIFMHGNEQINLVARIFQEQIAREYRNRERDLGI